MGLTATITTMAREKSDTYDPAALYRLMAWLSPAYPIGAFSYSSGIEWAVEAGDIADAATLERWLAVMVADSGGFCDAVFMVHAYRATASGDDAALRRVAELAAVFAPSKERHLETTAQGRAFLDTTRAAWPCAALDRLLAAWDGAIALPVAVGVASAGHRIALAAALPAYLHAMTANLISSGVRLIPLGQTDGQRVLAALEPVVAATAARALDTALDDVGGAAFRADLASMRHETQYTRLFRS
jgi:urease accessory protein